MPINNLIPSISKKTSTTNKYLAIEITTETVKAAVWDIFNHQPRVLQTGSIEEVDAESDSLLQAVNISVTKAQDGLEPEPKQVIFSLPENWISQGQVVTAKKAILKEISQKLDLKPLGFVITTEALVHYLKHLHGSPPTTLLIGVSDIEIIVTLVEKGEVISSQTVGRSDDICADVQEGIARFGDLDSLPASMTLYDGHTDLEGEKQMLISFNWQESLPFLHIPKIETLAPDETVKAVAIAGGLEVIANLQDQHQAEPESTDSSAEPAEEELPDLSQEFGFSATPNTPPAKPSHQSVPFPNPQDEGFVVHDPQSDHAPADTSSAADIDDSAAADEPPLRHRPKRKFPLLSQLSLPSFSLPNLKNRLPLIVVVVVGLLAVLIAGGAYAFWTIPHAQVTLYLEPKIIDTTLTFTLDPNLTQPDLATSTLPAKPMEASATDSTQAEVTGEKLVGDQATGTVTLYNRTDSTKTFTAGTRLTGPDDLRYTLDDDVTIASASTKENPDLSITIQPAQADVAVTASSIGAQYNQGVGTEFQVSNFDSSSFVAKAKSDLIGGTSRQITAVSQQDQDQLSATLKPQLQTKALEQINQNSSGSSIGAIIIPDEQEVFTPTFSAAVGDEAKQLTLEATLAIKTMTYKKTDLALLIEKTVKDSIADNYQLLQEDFDLNVADATLNDDGSLVVEAAAKAKVTPILNQADIINNIKGRYPRVTESYFTSLPNYDRVEIELQPQLPARLAVFPRNPANIALNIKTKD